MMMMIIIIIIIICIKVITNNNNTHEMHEQHARKVLDQGTTRNSHAGRCIPTSESTNVKEQNIEHGK
jgi:hypothetical protein